MVYVCNAVTIEDGVMISAGTIFTNDRFPRATTPDLKELRSSDPDEHTLPTLVREGATIGAACTIGNDLVIGRWAMVGMGSIVTKSVPDFHLVLGSPARSVGAVCRCGQLMVRFPKDQPANFKHIACPNCGLKYSIHDGDVEESGGTNAEGREPEVLASFHSPRPFGESRGSTAIPAGRLMAPESCTAALPSATSRSTP